MSAAEASNGEKHTFRDPSQQLLVWGEYQPALVQYQPDIKRSIFVNMKILSLVDEEILKGSAAILAGLSLQL